MSVTLVVTKVSAESAGSLGERLTFDQPRIVIGRGAHADVRLPSRAVSETHAVVRFAVGELALVDEGSTNGTAVNGQLVARGRKKLLKPGDRIEVPGFEIVLESTPAAPDPAERTATVARRLLAAALAASGGEAAPPELVLETGRKAGQVWKFPPAPCKLTAGRGEICEVILDDVDCSRQHVEFARSADGVMVRDLGSKNGVLVGERKVTERRLRDGDRIQVGRTVLLFQDPAEELLRAFDGGTDEPAEVSARPAAASDPGGSGSLPPPASTSGTPETVGATPSVPPPASDTAATPATPATTGPGEATETPGSPAASSALAAAADARASRHRNAADWVVIALAVVILLVSVAALIFLLRGTPAPTR